MTSNLRLLPFALACIGAGVALALVLRLRPHPLTPASAEPFAPTSTRELWADLAEETPLPEELAGPQRYLEERWGHLDESALALAAIEPDGEPYYILTEPVEGKNARGETIHAVGFAKPQRFSGPVFRTSAESGAQGGQLMRAPAEK
jgi:hypothetical protein